jgi:hypothetical protein
MKIRYSLWPGWALAGALALPAAFADDIRPESRALEKPVTARAFADEKCIEQCDTQSDQCMAASDGDPDKIQACDDQYSDCLKACDAHN